MKLTDIAGMNALAALTEDTDWPDEFMPQKTAPEKWKPAFEKYRDVCQFLLKLDLAGFGVMVTWITVLKYGLWDIGFFAPLIEKHINIIEALVVTTFGFDLWLLGMWVAMTQELRITKALLWATHIGLAVLLWFHFFIFNYAIGAVFGFLDSTREHMNVLPHP